tara:strand:- start:878 stop:1387 length:510 start_codon:yes stop_codon:yes gene_type:complete
MVESIKAKLILEIMGRPAEHIKEGLNTLVVKMGSEEGIELIEKEYNEPKKVEKAEDLWTAFADVDAEFESLEHFFNVVMAYMPSHVEIYEPDKFKLDSPGINHLSNFLVSRLHRYDSIAKKVVGEKEILFNKLEFLRKGGDPKEVFEKIDGKLGVEGKARKVGKKKKGK